MRRSTGDELPKLDVVGVIESHVLQGLEHRVGADGQDAGAAAKGHVLERVRQRRLADADRAGDCDGACARGNARRRAP